MPTHHLHRLLHDLLDNLSAYPNIEFQYLTNDSRAVTPGSLFIATPGLTVDGRDYITAAIEQGAVAVLYDPDPPTTLHLAANIPLIPIPHLTNLQSQLAARFYNQPTASVTTIGVTGTNGKTSCTQYIAQALASHQQRCAVIGTNGFGFLPNLQKALHTTPDPIKLQQHLAQLQQQGATAIAMEVSSHGLDQHRVDGIDFTIAVYTQLSRDHLDYHGTMEHYAKAKERLFQMPGLQYGIVNLDDEFGRTLAARYQTHYNMIGYTTQPGKLMDESLPVIQATHIDVTADGFKIAVATPWGKGEITTQLVGRFNISNLLAVLGVLGALDIPLDKALTYLATIQTVPGRMQRLIAPNQPQVVVDYSHTPDALAKALQALREHCRGQLWCVFGCGGDRDTGKRPEMAKVAEQYSDQVIVTNDNPRTESPEKIAADIAAGFKNPQSITTELDRARAIHYAVRSAGMDDIVLIAGKGHEQQQIIGREAVAFSDVLEVQKLFNASAPTGCNPHST